MTMDPDIPITFLRLSSLPFVADFDCTHGKHYGCNEEQDSADDSSSNRFVG